MRLGRSQNDHLLVGHGDRLVDASRVDDGLPADPLAVLGDERTLRRVGTIERGQPPRTAFRSTDAVQWAPPVTPGRVLMRGGAERDFAPAAVVGHTASLPAGTWHAGVAAVAGASGIAGFTVFHESGDVVALGPWLVTPEEAGDPLGFRFSAFADDLPAIRPVKALLDWEGEMARAEPQLAPGDVLALCAPPAEGGEDLRASLASDGRVLCRLEAHVR